MTLDLEATEKSHAFKLKGPYKLERWTFVFLNFLNDFGWNWKVNCICQFRSSFKRRRLQKSNSRSKWPTTTRRLRHKAHFLTFCPQNRWNRNWCQILGGGRGCPLEPSVSSRKTAQRTANQAGCSCQSKKFKEIKKKITEIKNNGQSGRLYLQRNPTWAFNYFFISITFVGFGKCSEESRPWLSN